MSKGSKKRRQFEIRKKTKHQEELRRLERRYFAARTRAEERAATEKIKRLAPTYPAQEIRRPAA